MFSIKVLSRWVNGKSVKTHKNLRTFLRFLIKQLNHSHRLVVVHYTNYFYFSTSTLAIALGFKWS
jgi:hypothetical protein